VKASSALALNPTQNFRHGKQNAASAVTEYSRNSLPMQQLLLNEHFWTENLWHPRLSWAGCSIPRSSGTVGGGGSYGAIILAGLVKGWVDSAHGADCKSLWIKASAKWHILLLLLLTDLSSIITAGLGCGLVV
jgi:hypothetical protein